MNAVLLTGRLGADPEGHYTPNGVFWLRFSLAVQRMRRGDDGNYPVDWIECIAWRNVGEYLFKYARKGDKVAVRGRLEVSRWKTKEGAWRRNLRVIVESAESLLQRRSDAEPEADQDQEEELPPEDAL